MMHVVYLTIRPTSYVVQIINHTVICKCITFAITFMPMNRPNLHVLAHLRCVICGVRMES